MEKYLIVGMVAILCIALVIYTQLGSNDSKGKQTFKQQVQKAFSQYQVIEKFDSIMICEVNHRNELEELVVIRIDPEQKKNVRQFGRRITITYPKQPSIKELQKDAHPYLNK